MANTNANNPLSSMSYTNKDFRAIYEELLDLVKKLTYKWDPSISNESDPGVILLKLNAIIGDKNNYNIDKNILEAFPETVTQEVSARSMYKQLAYNMPWYQSATTTVTFKWTGRDLAANELMTIPRYTMLTNSDNSIIYTLVEDVSFRLNSVVSTGRVIQGVINDLSINGATDLHLNNIDYNNRIYLNDYSVAENGIFITNVGEEQRGLWTAVKNLQVEQEGNMYYEFGVDSRSNAVYLEFPNDIETLIRNGLNIKYLVSDGIQGNVAAKEIIKFYDDVSITLGEESINLNEETIQMYNPSASTDGSDPEPVADAYNSYRRIAGTFDTLVTLRDYINAIYNSELVSNVIVSDRLTDIQSSYKIVTDFGGSAGSVIQVAKNSHGEPDLSAYNLRLYLLHSAGIVNSIDAYESTFDVESDTSQVKRNVINYITSQKCIQHDFVDIIENIPFLFRNLYPLRIKLVPQYMLTSVQLDDVKRKIVQALFETLNSREMDFGIAPDYNVVYDTILNADERIKLVVLDDFTYTTYATYWDGSQFKHIPISEFNDPYIIVKENLSELTAVILELNSPERYYFISSSENNKVYRYVSGSLTEYSTLIQDFRQQVITKSILAGVTPLYNQETTFDYTIDQSYETQEKDISRISTNLIVSPFGFDTNGDIKTYDGTTNLKEYTLKENESLQFLAPSFITEINYSNYVKFELILQNTTADPELQGAEYSKYDSQTGNYEGKPVTYWAYDSQYKPIEIGEGPDALKAIDPITGTSYLEGWEKGTIGIYIYVPVRRINPNTDYKLKDGDFITFYYKEVDEDDAPYVYRCYKGINNETQTEKSPIIRATFTLNGHSISEAKVDPRRLASSGTISYNSAKNSAYQLIYSMYGDYDLSGSKSIDIRNMNQVVLTKDEHYYYFITNDIRTDEETDISKYYMTFKQMSNGTYDYTLKTDEYFIYTNSNLTEFELLGPGTLVRLLSNPDTSQENDVTLSVDLVNYEDIAMYGIESFADSTVLLSVDTIVREQQIYNLTAGDSVQIEIDTSKFEVGDSYPSFSTDQLTVVDDFTVRYSTDGNVYTDLPGIDIDDDEASWQGTAILNIDASWDDAQVINNGDPEKVDNEGNPIETIENRQSIQQITINGQTYPTDDEIKNASLLYLLSNVSLTKVGGDNVDVTYIDAYGERMNLELLVYSLNPDFNKDNGFFRLDGDLCLYTDGQSHTVDNINLQTGYNYIMGIINNSTTSKFKISNQNGPLHCLTGDDSNGYGQGNYYFMIDNMDSSTATNQLIFETTVNDLESFVIIEHLVKCTPNNLFEERYGITAETIENLIPQYDKDENGKGLFKYNYKVDSATMIEDPLIAKTFFEENHVCNGYTIGKAQLRMSNVNASDSSIVIINNR